MSSITFLVLYFSFPGADVNVPPFHYGLPLPRWFSCCIGSLPFPLVQRGVSYVLYGALFVVAHLAAPQKTFADLAPPLETFLILWFSVVEIYLVHWSLATLAVSALLGFDVPTEGLSCFTGDFRGFSCSFGDLLCPLVQSC